MVLCSNELLLAILLAAGIFGYLVIRLKNRIIEETRRINHDLYRAIIFPHRKTYEADKSGVVALFLYYRFKKEIAGNEYPELRQLKLIKQMISASSSIFLTSVLCFVFWVINCHGL